uniref:Uncharacterized protein n=1 Tax=Aegilops tauschii subsp. strangulata TaxID=200361 RepID=A0A453IEE5_AEGTS
MGEVEDILKDYEVKKEGEAEILMLASNAVFFNPVQVSSRSYLSVVFIIRSGLGIKSALLKLTFRA